MDAATQARYRQCFELFAQRRYENCARASMPLIDQVKTHELLQIYLISLYRSGGHEFADGLASAVDEATAHDPWTNTLLRLTTGQAAPEAVTALIGDDRQKCQGWYYIGANQLTHGYPDQARNSFDASLAAGVPCTEADLARIDRDAPIVSPVAQRGGMRDDQFDWFQNEVRSAEQALQEGRGGDAAGIAEEMFQQACDTLDEDGIGMGVAMQQIASVHMRLGDAGSAGRLYREACDLYRENVGARHFLHVTCLRQLAAAEASTGSAPRVADLLQEKERLVTLVLGTSRED